MDDHHLGYITKWGGARGGGAKALILLMFMPYLDWNHILVFFDENFAWCHQFSLVQKSDSHLHVKVIDVILSFVNAIHETMSLNAMANGHFNIQY
jgi:hypothetical protein